MSLRLRRRPAGRRQAANPLKVGIGVLVAVLAISYAGIHKRLPFASRWTLNAVFANSDQLRAGAPVRIAGVDVGTVTGLHRGANGTAVVTMAIDSRGLPIHRDAELTIRPRLFFEGSFYVQLDPGTPNVANVNSGDEIPVAQTDATVQTPQFLTVFNRSIRDNFSDAIEQFAVGLNGGGAEGFNQFLRNLPPALRNSAILEHASQGTSPGDLARLVRYAAALNMALAATDGHLGHLVQSFGDVISVFGAHSTALAQTVAGFDAVARRTPAALAALDASLPSLEHFAGVLRPVLGPLPPVLKHTASVLTELDALSQPGQLPVTVADVSKLTSMLPAFEQGELTLLPRVTPVVKCVGVRVVPLLEATIDDASLSTGRPVWQDLVHATVGLAGSSQDFDANGNWLRLLVDAGTTKVSTTPSTGSGPVVAGLASQIQGTRPVWLGPGVTPAFRPDQICDAQPMTDLSASSGPAFQNVGGSGPERVSGAKR